MAEADLFFVGERLSRQPPWSDLPVILLALSSVNSTAVRKVIRSLGNVTLLERPVPRRGSGRKAAPGPGRDDNYDAADSLGMLLQFLGAGRSRGRLRAKPRTPAGGPLSSRP